jgi:DNA-binding NarL/FixJ family response regulator
VTRVLIVAGSPVTRAGLESVLARSASIAVVGVASRDDSLTATVEAHDPDVVLLDVEGLSLGGPSVRLDPSPDAVARAPSIVLLADVRDAAWIADALRRGVRAVLPRDATPDEIVAAVEGVGSGLTVLPNDLADTLLAAVPASVRAPAPSNPSLTPRETEILGMLAEGLANKAIAARLGISEHTVKTHVASVFAKLEAYTRTEAVARAVRLGIIML